MFPALIGAGASLLGGILSNQATSDRLQDQMAFQERMSSTAYQRGMADMKKAGLNPILAYQKGPASSPTGAFASATDVVTPAVASAQAGLRLTQELENMKEQNFNIKADTMQKTANTTLATEQAAKTNTENKISQEMLQVAIRDAAKSATDEEFYKSPGGRLLRMLGTGMRELNPFISGTSAISTMGGR